jgi:hypothetical protein
MSEVQLSWNTHQDAVLGFQSWDMSCQSNIAKLGGAYLMSPALCAEEHPPAVLAPFLCSIRDSNLPGGYDPLSDAKKALYNSESNAYLARKKTAKDSRAKHLKVVNDCISWLEDSFTNDCTCRKNMQTIERIQDAVLDAQALPRDRAFTFRALMAMIKKSFSPTQCTDAEAILLKIVDADFRDGRGFERNAVEFVENFELLVQMSQPPLPLIMSKHLTKAVAAYPHCASEVALMVRAINSDIAAEAAATAAAPWRPPAVPRFQEYLEIMSADVKGTPSWDYISGGSSRPVMNANAKKSGEICARCGKLNHSKEQCKGWKCVCGKELVTGQCLPNHNVRDAVHDKGRADLQKWHEENPSHRKPSDSRDLSRSNPKQQHQQQQRSGDKRKQSNRSSTESRLDDDLRLNDEQNRKMTLLIKSGTALSEENRLLRKSIEAGVDSNLKSICSMVPATQLQGHGQSKKGKKSGNQRARGRLLLENA